MDYRKAVGYARISSESQRDNTSIELQVEKIRDYAKLHDIELGQIYIDECYSGSNENRPQYRAMMEEVESGEIKSIIVLKADRIHRSARNLLNMIYQLNEKEVSLVSITESFIDTGTSQGRLFITMMGGFSEFERDMITERTAGGRIAKGKTSKYAGGRVPYGYDLVDSDMLEVIPDEAAVVKKIFELRKKGHSLQKVADYINKSGALNRNGKPWSRQAIDYVLKNRVYIGEYEYHGSKEKNDIRFKVPSIVSKQLWNKVNG